MIEPLESRQLFAVTVIDVAIVYTTAAKNGAGGADVLLQRVRRGIADTNFVFANSQINATLRLVSSDEISSYTESGSILTDLERLQNDNDAMLDEAQLFRDRSGADLVHLFVNAGSGGSGIAYQLDDPTQAWPDYGYGVSLAKSAADNYHLAHETLHLLGAGHDDVTHPGPHVLPYAYEHTFIDGTQKVGGVLTYANRIPYTSNPSLTWRGHRLGVADGTPEAQASHAADNTKAVRQFLPLVAGNRTSTIADAAVPLAALNQISTDASGRTLFVEVKLADHTAINVATLDGNDLRVTGPNGFNKLARFVGVDQATNGAQRLARYSVDITGFSADPSAYTPTLVGSQIADVTGRFVTAGVLGRSDPSQFADRATPRLLTAMDFGNVNGTRRKVLDGVSAGGIDPSNHYRFVLTQATSITAKISGMSANANLFLIRDANEDGQIQTSDYLQFATQTGTADDVVAATLQAGTYDLWVAPVGAVTTNYTLTLQAGGTPVSPPPPPPPPPPTGSGSVSGTLWQDNNGNGVRESSEPGLPGWTVYADRNNNNQPDAGDVLATTNSSGAYKLQGLSAATYAIRSTLKSGYRRTTAAVYSVPLAAGQAAVRNFGVTNRALVSGSVYLDANNNKVRDSGEAILSSWQVYIDVNKNGRFDTGERSILSDASGNWAFKDVLAGSYVVRVVVKSGYAVTNPTAGYSVTLSSGQSVTGKHFGLRKL